ncbi:hypothetical protein K439DRAFT_1626568 [Ramaria rubella]|nr:hypothetical protein K439DRAFT_1626568 [Ramaria rubella]
MVPHSPSPHHTPRPSHSLPSPLSQPQLHSCTHCQASFTRKTHLTRHLRSHLDQRTFQCPLCAHASFTRSDLLTRHMRRCALNPPGVPFSRKKACQTCVRRKVRCDLQMPCEKCVARGETCVYPGQEERARVESESEGVCVVAHAQDGERAVASESEALGSVDVMAAFIDETLGSDGSAPTSTPSALDTAAHIELADPLASIDLYNSEYALPWSPTYNSGIFSEGAPRSPTDNSAVFPGGAVRLLSVTNIKMNGLFTLPDLLGPPFDFNSCTHEAPLQVPRPLASSFIEPVPDIAMPETDVYLSHFFSIHCQQYPFFHLPTWSQSAVHPLLVQAMRMCGALYVVRSGAEGMVADTFILDTLRGELRHQIFRAFIMTLSNDTDVQVQLILAMITVQNTGLFHGFAIERSVSAACHAMIVTMVKRSSLLAFVQNWEPPVMENCNMYEAWKSWARYETIKRAVTLCYLHDTLMPVFHDTAPAFDEYELDFRLPCDDELWDAPDHQQWAQCLSSPTPPSSPRARLLGESLKTTVTGMLSPALGAVLPPLNRFASFIVLHSLMRAIYQSKNTTPYEQRFAIQYALTQWYIDRINTASASAPASPQSCGSRLPTLNFTSIALLLYWLTQLMHGEATASSPGHGPGPAASGLGARRFSTAKRWLRDFWLVIKDVGEVGAAATRDCAFVREVADGVMPQGNSEDTADAGLLEWVLWSS